MPDVRDLSRPLCAGMPHARTIPAPHIEASRTWAEHHMRAMRLDIPTHIGTHLDAPSHFVEDGTTIDQVDPSLLVGPAYCLELLRPGADPVSAADIATALEAVGVELVRGDALLLRTGWDERYGTEDYIDRHAYLTPDAAKWCAASGLRLVGIDTITPEYPMGLRDADYQHEVHHELLGAGTLIIENLLLEAIGGRWVTLIVGALLVTGGDGAPARVLAVCDPDHGAETSRAP